MKMSKGHNKKRNVGLIYEQVTNKAAEAMMQGRPELARQYAQFLKKHFTQGSELLKEFKLFNAILDTSGVSEKVADRVLELARESTNAINFQQLDREKGTFINEANRLFGKGTLFSTHVRNFRALATVQSLMNEWRNPGTLSLSHTAQYENQLREFMMLTSTSDSLQIIEGVDDVSVRMFHKRFDDTYGDKFTSSQRDFLCDLTFKNTDEITDIIASSKQKVLGLLLDNHAIESNMLLREKYDSVYQNISEMNPADEKAPARQLTILQLIDELENKNG